MKKLLFFLVIATMLLAACAPTQPVATTAPMETEAPVAPATEAPATEAPVENPLAGTTITVMLPLGRNPC